MSRTLAQSRFAPWAGWLAAGLALILNHQGMGDMVFFDCRLGNASTALLTAAASLAIAGVGGTISWRARRSEEGHAEPNVRYFVAALGASLPALFAFTILLQALAGILIPTCAR